MRLREVWGFGLGLGVVEMSSLHGFQAPSGSSYWKLCCVRGVNVLLEVSALDVCA